MCLLNRMTKILLDYDDVSENYLLIPAQEIHIGPMCLALHRNIVRYNTDGKTYLRFFMGVGVMLTEPSSGVRVTPSLPGKEDAIHYYNKYKYRFFDYILKTRATNINTPIKWICSSRSLLPSTAYDAIKLPPGYNENVGQCIVSERTS